MTREEALKIILSFEIGGDRVGYVVSAKDPGVDVPIEEATDEQLIGAAEFLLKIQSNPSGEVH